jgi:hypothetical protein
MPAPSQLPGLDPYVFEPLTSKNSLRLLRLRPASDEQGDIDCELVERVFPEDSTAAPLNYEAMSWYWGRGKQDQILRIHKGDNVFAFNISQNLKSALWALRRHNTVRQLWIDAICIDQANTKERNEQVPKMDIIYGNARSVCIWLGEGDEQSKVAIDFIKQKVLQLWEFDKLIEDRNMAEQWRALVLLMKRPWFSRRV